MFRPSNYFTRLSSRIHQRVFNRVKNSSYSSSRKSHYSTSKQEGEGNKIPSYGNESSFYQDRAWKNNINLFIIGYTFALAWLAHDRREATKHPRYMIDEPYQYRYGEKYREKAGESFKKAQNVSQS